MSDKDKVMNVSQVAEYLSISKAHVYKWTSTNKIPHYKPGGKRVYFFKSEIDDFVRNSKIEEEN